MIHLRRFQYADLTALHRIDQICFPPGIAYSKAELRYYLQHATSFTVIAETDSQTIAGFCIGQLFLHEGKRLGHIITIDVLPEARRQRVGSLLLRAVEKHFREKEVESVRLEVAVDNEQAQRFYQPMGYTRIGVIPGYYGGKLDAIVMQKPLTGDA